MPAIVAPSPRYPSQHSCILAQDSALVRPCPVLGLLPSHAVHSRTFLSPPRLLSPIRLHDSPYLALSSRSPTPCGPIHKRRASSRLLARSNRRRRHPQRVDCPLDALGRPSIFDQLPWISALEMPGLASRDIADLSQLPVTEDPVASSEAMPASGPVRHRKSSLRSNPLTSGHESPLGDPRQVPIYCLASPPPECPRTPSPRIPFDPSHVTFHKLMPVFPRGVNPSTSF